MGVVLGMLLVGLVASAASAVYVHRFHRSSEDPEHGDFSLAALPLILAAVLFLGTVLAGLILTLRAVG